MKTIQFEHAFTERVKLYQAKYALENIVGKGNVDMSLRKQMLDENGNVPFSVRVSDPAEEYKVRRLLRTWGFEDESLTVKEEPKKHGPYCELLRMSDCSAAAPAAASR